MNRKRVQMDIQAEKLYLIEKLTRLQDVSMIKRIKELLQSMPNEEIAGSDSNGQVITQSDLIARAEASEKAINKGDVISIESLEEESENW